MGLWSRGISCAMAFAFLLGVAPAFAQRRNTSIAPPVGMTPEAHAIVLAERQPAFQQIRVKIFGDLQSYYGYRHGGSAAGLQQLIDKYKPR